MRFVLLMSLMLAAGVASASDRDQPPPLHAKSIAPKNTTSNIAPPVESDTTFVVNSGSGLDTGCTFRSGGPLVITLKIPRVLSDTIANLVAKGGLGATARIFFPAYDVDYDGGGSTIPPERDLISLNGTNIDNAAGVGPYLNGYNNAWYLNEFKVPVGLLNFGSAGTPGDNVLQIDIDTASGSDENWCTGIDWVAVTIEAPVPALLLHGFLSDGPGAWAGGGVLQGLNDDGVQNSGSDISIGGFDSIADNAGDIKSKIAAYKQAWGIKRVQLIGHSKGGLDSRGYIESGAYDDDVVRLIQVGSPNKGSPAADVGTVLQYWLGGVLASALNPALINLSTTYMAYFNARHGANPAVPTISFAGVHTGGNCLLSGWTWLLGDNDGIVPLGSAHGLPYATKLGPLNSSSDDSCHTGMNKSRLVYDQYLRSYALAADAQGTSNKRKVAGTSDGNMGAVMLAQSMASVAVGAEATLEFPLAGGGGESFAIAFAGDPAQYDISLRLPNGDIVTPTSGTGATIGDLGLGSLGLIQGTISSTQTGTARVIVKATRTTANSKLVLSAFPAGLSDAAYIYAMPEIGVVGADTSLRFSMTRNAAALALTGGSVTVTYADAHQATVPLTVDGSDLTGVLRPDAAGTVLMTLTAQTASGTRVSNVLFPVIDPAVTLSSDTASAVTTLDTNGNGLIDVLQVPVTLAAPAPGDYDIRGELRTSGGQSVIGVGRLTAGAAEAVSGVLSFPGNELYLSGENGPYTLVKASAIRVDSSQLVGESTLTRTTPAYDHTIFEHNPVLVGAIESSRGIDENGTDGIEAIEVSFPVEVDAAGTYTYSARLSSLFGDELGFQQKTSNLTAGSNVLTLRFPTTEIVARNLPPPFVVEGLLIFGNGGSAIRNVVGSINSPATSAMEGYVPCALAVTPSSVEFPLTARGSNSTAELSLAASGNNCVVTALDTAAPFAIGATTLPLLVEKDQTVKVTLSFAPTAAGPATGTLDVNSNDDTQPVQQVALSGSADYDCVFETNPGTLDFGTVREGSSATRQITVQNAADGPGCTLSSIDSDGAEFTFNSSVADGTALAAGQSFTIDVKFTPASTEASSATLTLTGAHDETATVAMSGSGGRKHNGGALPWSSLLVLGALFGLRRRLR